MNIELNQSHHSQQPQPEGHGNGGEQGGDHHDAGGQNGITPHILGHDVTGYGGGRTGHDQDGNQLVVGEAEGDCRGKEDRREDDQLKQGSPDGGLDAVDGLLSVEVCADTEQGKR